MSRRLHSAIAVISLTCSGAGIAQQAEPTWNTMGAPATQEVVQVQANPPGQGFPSPVPPNPESANTTVAPAMPADPAYQAGPYKGALTPPPVEAMNKVYSLCTRQLQDSCVNPGEAEIVRKRRTTRATRKRG